MLSETELMMNGYGLTTAEFFYRMPDYTHVLNSYIWQDYDLAPDHPKLFEFIQNCSSLLSSGKNPSKGRCIRSGSPIEKCCPQANGTIKWANLRFTDATSVGIRSTPPPFAV